MPGQRIAVIGCGRIGLTHLKAYRANGVAPVAVADVSEELAARAAGEFGGRAYSSYQDLLDRESCDAVSICTPPSLHVTQCLAALSARAAVLCEKPMAVGEVECRQLVAEVQRRDGLLAVGFCHRFYPPVERLKSLVEAGELGRLVMFHNRFTGHLAHAEERWFSSPEVAGGGVLFDTASHSVDLFRHLVGDVAGVRGLTATNESELGPALKVEDTGIITLRSREGALGVIEASWRTPPGSWTLSLFGTAGSATVDYTSGVLTVRNAKGEERTEPVSSEDRFTAEIRAFLNCLGSKRSSRLAMVEDGAETIRILRAAYRSAAGGE